MKMLFYLIIWLINLFLQAKCEIINDENIRTWESEHPYINNNLMLNVECAEGYTLAITIDKLDVAGEQKDFLLIKPGADLNDDFPGIIFTYKLKYERHYRFDYNKAYFAFQVHGDNEQNLDGFHLTYQCYGEALSTTTKSPTTSIDWPTPSPKDKIYYTVNVAGLHYTKYDEKEIESFRSALKDMATEYCKIQNFDLSSQITTSNVHINMITKCPYNWPNYESCVQIKFALPVFLKDSKLGYELTSEHLEMMWIRLSNKYLKKYKLEMYGMFDESDATIWIVGAAIVLLLFTIVLIIAKWISNRLRKTLNHPTHILIISPENKRNSDQLLHPLPDQVLPSFYEPSTSYYEANMNSKYDNEDETM